MELFKNQNLQNKNVLITGGTTGIGEATAELLAGFGANVMIFGRDETHLNNAVNKISENAIGRIIGIKADVSEPDDIKKVFARFDNEFKKIDVLINNAALPARSILESNTSKINRVLKTNISGYLLCSKEAIIRMKKEGGGHIVNICSMSARIREEDADLYVATKSAVDGFSDSIRKQSNRLGIKVSVINPGSVGTNMVDNSLEQQEELQEKYLMLKAKDIADAVVFCLTRPGRCEIMSIEIKPHRQII